MNGKRIINVNAYNEHKWRIEGAQHQHTEDGGSVNSGDSFKKEINVTAHYKMVTINITLTGNSGIPLATSDIMVTISGPSETLFTDSYSLGNNDVETIQFSVNEGETIGKWTLLLDSENQEFEPGDFSYDYEWYNYYPTSS